MGGWKVMPDRDPLTGVPPSRHPFQFWILAACFMSGLATTIFRVGPPTLRATLPDYAFVLWGLILLFGGGLGILAIEWRDRITGLLMERIALGAIAGGCLVWSIVVAVVAGKVGYSTSAYALSVGIAGAWRIVHITRQLKLLQHGLGQHGDRADS